MSVVTEKNGADPGKNGVNKESGRIAIRDFSAGYGKTGTGVRNVEMGILPRTATAIIGPSGCGKSTLLRCVEPHARADSRARGRPARSSSTAQDLYGATWTR